MSSAAGISQVIVTVGVMMTMASLIVVCHGNARRSQQRTGDDPQPGLSSAASDAASDDREEFHLWRQQMCQSPEDQTRPREQQRQRLNNRMLRYRKFLEYPPADGLHDSTELPQTEMTERDREVRRILELEAARIYERIRADEYRASGQLDAAKIRTDILEVIQRVAQVYLPNSSNPLLETSFDQLARTASRFCLQVLVLAEQLPLDVPHYTIAELYSYVRKAVSAWRAWQVVSPWTTRITRGMYAGRILAGSNLRLRIRKDRRGIDLLAIKN